MVKTFSIKIGCPRDGITKTVYIIASDSPKIGYCNGCDDLNGDPACSKCTTDITAQFNSGELIIPQQ